jgi:hypothetical protein
MPSRPQRGDDPLLAVLENQRGALVDHALVNPTTPDILSAADGAAA